MKLTKIALACAMALAAGQSFAHGPSVTPDLEVFISGSSALQNNLGKIAESMMPNTATTDVYYNTSDNGSSYRAYFGTVNGTGTSLDGKKVLMHERAAGGSIYGVNPVAQATPLARMKIEAATCAATGVAYPAATYKCSATVNAVPDAGVSDVEPAMFVGDNLPSGWSALTTSELGNLTISSQNAVVFGIAVSDTVYNAGVTSLSRSQVTSLLSGAYQDWGMIKPSLTGKFVRVERRGAGSGTQASANAYFGGFPCSPNAVGLSTAQVNNPGVYEVVENSSTGLVKSGLIADNTAGKYAIGLISAENTAPATGWKFVSIDGVAPTVPNAIAGKYDYFVEQSMQWRNTTVNGVAAPVAGGDMDTFLNTFLARSGDPAILSTMPGVAALPTNYTPALDVNGVVTNSVMKGTKLTHTCAPTQLYN